MATIFLGAHPNGGVVGRCATHDLTEASADCALVRLGQEIKQAGYRFITVTPASHARVVARPIQGRPSLRDVFGWSRPFAAGDLPERMLTRMADAGVVEIIGPLLRSKVRFSTLEDQLFVHSAFPTTDADAVFFGPDTYRFARLIRRSIGLMERQSPRHQLRILDIGAGSGAGGLHAAKIAAPSPTIVTLSDINRRALRFCRLNAALNKMENVQIVESDLCASVEGYFDLILANPPYLVDPLRRMYRHGGGDFGFELSMQIIEQGMSRLAPGGRIILYTGSAIVDGIDLFHETFSSKLARCGVAFAYEEIDADVFGEELDRSPYDRAERIAVVGVIIDAD